MTPGMLFTIHLHTFSDLKERGSEDQMTLSVDNSNPHSNCAWMVSQDSMQQVQGVRIAVSQLIKIVLLVNNERIIFTQIL